MTLGVVYLVLIWVLFGLLCVLGFVGVHGGLERLRGRPWFTALCGVALVMTVLATGVKFALLVTDQLAPAVLPGAVLGSLALLLTFVLLLWAISGDDQSHRLRDEDGH